MCGASRTRGAAGRQSQWPVGWPLGCGGGVPPSIKPLGRVVGGVGRSNLDRLRVRGRCAQCANPGAGSAEPLPPPARAAVRWRDGVTVPWQPLRQRAATKDTTRREVSVRGGDWIPISREVASLCGVFLGGRGTLQCARLDQLDAGPRLLVGPVLCGEPSWRWPQGRCYVPRA